MLCILSNTTNPYFNIATEEYLLKNFTDDIVFLYINEPSVILGKHQNALAEINYKYVCEHNIPVIRRISGGGTVYHDNGNLNFSFIRNGKEGHLIDFKKFTQPIINALIDLGIDAKLEGKNDIRVNGLKISGNAEHVYKNRVLHHGTILFSANLNNLSDALKVIEGKYTDNAVKSIRSKVANIKPLINSTLHINEFTNIIYTHITKNTDVSNYTFTSTDLESINDLVTKKYNNWEWNFAYSPEYTFSNKATISKTYTYIFLKVKNGIILTAEIKTDDKMLSEIEAKLIGEKHDYKNITLIINNLTKNVFTSEKMEELTWLFF